MNEIRVTKSYHNRNTNENKVLNGTLRTDLSREAVSDLLGQSKIATIDPHIEWDEDFTEGNGWDYVDFSFDVSKEIACRRS